jgi:valyl-tRNA synthetase
MRLLHPFMPFLTETLWQLTPHTGTSIMLADWPVPRDATGPLAMDPNAVATFEALQTLVRAVRNARAEYNVEPGKKVAALVRASPAFKEAVEGEAAALVLLGRLDAGLLQVIGFDAAPPSEQAVHLVIADGLDVWLPMSGLVDTEKERARLTKQADKLTKDIAVLQGRLTSQGFVDKAPAEKVEKVRADAADKAEQLAAVQKSLAELG